MKPWKKFREGTWYIFSIHIQILICFTSFFLPHYPPSFFPSPVGNGHYPQFAEADRSPHLSSSAPPGLSPASLCLVQPFQPLLAPLPPTWLEPMAHKWMVKSKVPYDTMSIFLCSECVSVQIISKKCFHTTPLSINTQMFCLYMWTPMCLIRNAFTFGDLNFIWYMIFNSSYVIKDTKMTILLASL